MTNNKIPILIVGPYPPPFSGPEMAMKTILDSPLKNDFKVAFINTNFRKSNINRGRVDLYSIISLIRLLFTLFWKLISIRPKIFYYFVTATRMGWLGRDIWCIFISHLFKAKVVIHMRAGHFKNNYTKMSNINKYMINCACKYISLGIVQAVILKEQLEGLIPKERVVSIYNAIDTNKFTNPDISNYQNNVFLYLGHLSYAKGYCDLLKTIPLVANKHPEIIFQFAGLPIKKERNVFYNQITGEALSFEDPEECYDKYINGKYDKNYKYLGVLDEVKKIEAIKHCNALILPSYSEGFSMSVLESMSMGKPIICTPVGALGEIIQNNMNGLIIDPGDIDALNIAIEKLLNNKEFRNKIANNNYNITRKNYSVEIVSTNLKKEFLSIL